MGDTVFLDTELDTLDMEVTDSDMPVVMEVTVLDTAMMGTVARDPLKPGVYMDVAMEVMVDTPVDTVIVDTAVDTVMVDTDGKHFQPNSPMNPFYQKQVSTFIGKDNLKMRENFDRNLP